MTAQYMLDTNAISDIMRNPAGSVAQHIAQVGDARISVSIITASELRYGAAKNGSPRLIAKVEAILQRVPIHPLVPPVDVAYGAIRSELEAKGTPIGPNDLLIAAHAKTLGATLVTANTAEFNRVPDLQIENWLI